MNSNEHLASLIVRRDALNDIRLRFESDGGMLTAIGDFCDDSDTIGDADMRDLMITLLGIDFDITSAAETIYLIGGIDLGTRFCAMNELCADHFCDIENCIDDH